MITASEMIKRGATLKELQGFRELTISNLREEEEKVKLINSDSLPVERWCIQYVEKYNDQLKEIDKCIELLYPLQDSNTGAKRNTI